MSIRRGEIDERTLFNDKGVTQQSRKTGRDDKMLIPTMQRVIKGMATDNAR